MWIIPQHHTQIERFYNIINLLKNVKSSSLKEVRKNIISELKKTGQYNGRQTKDIQSAGNHNIDEPFFYGLIYKINKEVFISGYGELIYSVWNDSYKKTTVFLFSLINIQYFHPAKPKVDASLFPFRLFFKILRDKRINNKISIPEMYFLYKIDFLNTENDFENLILKILNYRNSSVEIKNYFKGFEKEFVKSSASSKYFFKILENFNVLLEPDNLKKNQSICSPLRRDATSINVKFFKLNETFVEIIDILLKKYSIFEKPRKSELPSELISEIFNYVDKDIYEYLEIKEEKDYSLADNIYDYSIDPNKCYDFELKINQAMRLFYNIESEVVGGASEPDFVARYEPNFPSKDNYKIFTGDAKATKNQLMGINPGRLKQHMNKYKSNFTILVTPKYAPAAKNDIKGENIVILSSLALSEITRNIIKYDDKPSFEPFYNIIISNLGDDVSSKFYEKVSEIYGINI